MSEMNIPSEYKQACADLRRCGTIIVQRALREGRSGACVFVVDVTGNDLNGYRILKLDTRSREAFVTGTGERARHEAAVACSTTFASRHIPAIEDYGDDSTLNGDKIRTAIVYRIAGDRILPLKSLNEIDSHVAARCLQDLSESLLLDFNAKNKDSMAQHSPIDCLQQWLAHKLQKPRLDPYANADTKDISMWMRIGSQSYVNPLWFWKCLKICGADKMTTFMGMLHGDLHAGNIQVRTNGKANANFEYWLIDFGDSRPGPLLFDHAYLEIAWLIAKFGESELSDLDQRVAITVNALEQWEQRPKDRTMERTTDSLCLPELLAIRKGRRKALDEWDTNQNRADCVLTQRLLAGVAASLNWLSKRGLNRQSRLIALVYGAVTATLYFQTRRNGQWQKILQTKEDRPATGAPRGGFNVTHRLEAESPHIHQLSWSSDGDRLAWVADHRTIAIWNRRDESKTRHETSVDVSDWAIAWSPRHNDNRLAYGAEDGSVWVWDMKPGKGPSHAYQVTGAVRSLAWSPDAEYLAAGHDDGGIRLWRVGSSTSNCVYQVPARKLIKLEWIDASKFIVFYDSQCILWDTRESSGKPIPADALNHAVTEVACCETKGLIALATSHSRILILDCRESRTVAQIDIGGGTAHGLAFSPDGQWLVAMCMDNKIRLWKCDDSWKLVSLIDQKCDCRPMRLAFAPMDDSAKKAGGPLLLAVFGADSVNPVRVWEVDTEWLSFICSLA